MPNHADRMAAPIGVAPFPFISENPYQRLLYEALAGEGFALWDDADFKLGWMLRHRRRVRILHFHWPQDYYRHRPTPKGPVSWIKMTLFGLRLAAARVLGYRIAWTIHEVYPLKTASRRLDRLGGRLLARFSNVLVANDRDTAALAATELGEAAANVAVVPHSSYIGAYPEGRPRAEVRAELGIPDDTFVFLLFGHVSVYKRVEWFVDTFRRLESPRVALIVAGLVMHEESGAAVRDVAARDQRIKPLLEFIPDDRVAELFGAADAAIAPRQDGGTSGALILALSMGLGAVAAAVPIYEELSAGDAAAWLFSPYDAESLLAALEAAAADPAGARRKGTAGRQLMQPHSWDEMGRRTARLLTAAVEPGRSQSPEPAPEHA